MFGGFKTKMYFCIEISKEHTSKSIKAMLLADKLKQLRDEAKQPQRRVAAFLDIDTATYCKMEKGKYLPSREQVLQLSYFFKYDSEEMIKLWLADRLIEVAKDEDMANDAIRLVQDMLNTNEKKEK